MLVYRASCSDLVSQLTTSGGPPDVAQLAHGLVRRKLLTTYQAAAIYQGKCKHLFIGDYIVLERIGKGGMGLVFKVCHRDHREAVVALKVLTPSFSRKNHALVKRFRQEAEALARMQHPSIVHCIDPVKEVNGAFYLVMEYVDGEDLKSLVQRYRRFSVEQSIDCLLQAARGLEFAHSLGVIHRDIKPANMMLDRGDTLRILDFGLARVMHPDSWIHVDQEGTFTGTIMGTIPYMSPEQAIDSKRADARSDIYSLGCTLHYLLTGRPPYGERTWSEMFLAHKQKPIPSLKAARRHVPDHLEALFKRMLAKDPADRPQTMASVIAEIELARDESRARPSSSGTITVRPDEPVEPDITPMFSLDDLVIVDPLAATREVSRFLGPRRRYSNKSIDYTPLINWLLLTIILVAGIIILIELVNLGSRGDEHHRTATKATLPLSTQSSLLLLEIQPGTFELRPSQERYHMISSRRLASMPVLRDRRRGEHRGLQGDAPQIHQVEGWTLSPV
jgi:serine/threonine protein kinase